VEPKPTFTSHLRVATNLENLAEVLKDLGEADEARQVAERARVIRANWRNTGSSSGSPRISGQS
jgi:hypothetical protein